MSGFIVATAMTINYDGGVTGNVQLRVVIPSLKFLESLYMNPELHSRHSNYNNPVVGNEVLERGVRHTIAVKGWWEPRSTLTARDAEFTSSSYSSDDYINHTTYAYWSFDGGATWHHIEPEGGVPTAYDPDHFYVYHVEGQGYPLWFSIADTPLYDNNGGMDIWIWQGSLSTEDARRELDLA